MRFGMRFNCGDIVLTKIQFVDTREIKIKPVSILFEEMNNVVVAGITSNLNMRGISLTKNFNKKDGAVKNRVIKLNYIFAISNNFIFKKLFSLNPKKKKQVFEELIKILNFQKVIS